MTLCVRQWVRAKNCFLWSWKWKRLISSSAIWVAKMKVCFCFNLMNQSWSQNGWIWSCIRTRTGDPEKFPKYPYNQKVCLRTRTLLPHAVQLFTFQNTIFREPFESQKRILRLCFPGLLESYFKNWSNHRKCSFFLKLLGANVTSQSTGQIREIVVF